MFRIKVPCTINTTGDDFVVLNPVSVLNNNTSYYVTATTDVKSTLDENLTSEFSSQFTTLAPLVYMHLVIENSWPDSFDFTNWPIDDTYMYMSFDYTIDESSVAGNIDLLLDGTSVPCNVFVELPEYPTDIDVIPTENLLSGRTYTINIKTGLTGEGHSLDQEYNVNITTGAELSMTLVESSPEDGDINVSCINPMYAQFDYNVAGASIEGNVLLVDSESNPVPFMTYITENPKIVFAEPTLPLNYGEVYTINILTGLQSEEGYYLDSEYNISFTTANAVLMHLTESDPTNDESSVAINKRIGLTFDYDIDAATIAGNVDLLIGETSVPAAINVWPEIAHMIMITPSNTHSPDHPTNLLNLTEYTIQVGTGLKSVEGYSLDQEYTRHFTTAIAVMSLIESVPIANDYSQEILNNQVITLTFNKNIDPTTVLVGNGYPNTLYLRCHYLVPSYWDPLYVPCTAEVVDNVITITPNANLTVNNYYDLWVQNGAEGIKAMDGEEIQNFYYTTGYFKFRVSSTSYMSFVSSDPVSGTVTDFSLTGSDSIAVTFDSNIYANSVYDAAIKFNNGVTTQNLSNVSMIDVNNNIITITPFGEDYGALIGGNEHTITFPLPSVESPGITSTTGNSLDSETAITFIAEPASNYMWKTSSTPTSGQTGRPRNIHPTITFDLNIDSGTVTYGSTGTVNLKRGSTNIAGSVSVVDNVITITPSALLNANSNHTFTVSMAVQSTTGKSLLYGVSITFRTGAT